MLFKRTKSIENQIDSFLDIIVQAVLTLREGINSYLKKDSEGFQTRLESISKMENQADDIRKHIETQLYTYSLIPESRGDVLGLLENMDNVIDRAKEIVLNFSIEHPDIPTEYNEQYLELVDKCVQSVEFLVTAVRHYFRDINSVKDSINKVAFYESEADRIAGKLKKDIFNSDLKLSQKQHLRDFTVYVEELSDMAESVSERLAISVIKRSI